MTTEKRTTPARKALMALLSRQPKHEFKVGDHRATVHAITVTGPQATEVIEFCNDRNRKVRQNKVAQFARAMKRKEWRLQNPILFAESGELIDGQHRLLAVAECGIEQPFLVQMIEEKEVDDSNLAVDSGTPRNLVDFLHFRGVDNATRVAPLMQLERNARISKSPFQVAQADKLDYLRLYKSIGVETVLAAFECVPWGLAKTLCVKRPILDWVALQLVQIDRGHAETFLGLVGNPAQLREDDAPYVAHQAFLESAARANKRRTSIPQVEHGTMLVKAWNAYYENRRVKLKDITFRIREEFPVILGSHR